MMQLQNYDLTAITETDGVDLTTGVVRLRPTSFLEEIERAGGAKELPCMLRSG